MDKKRIGFLFLLVVLLFGCSPHATKSPQTTPMPVSPEPASSSSPEAWWRDAVFYEIFVRSFYDTNGDGIGDFNGITQKLEYLESLGVNAIWLMPINPSPSYHGYDVTNYYAVNPEYGSMEDFKTLLAEAHKRGIRIIIDLVFNHTSSQHPFFVDANSGPDAKYRNWYVWQSENPGNMWHPGNGGYYFGLFWGGMPDLNYRNPEVTAQMFNVTRYWLEDIGVDGFRIDAAKHLIEEGTVIENTASTHEWFKGFYSYYKSLERDAYTVGEVYGAGAFLATTYEKQFDHIFNFELANGMVNSANGGSNTGINSAWKFTLKDIQEGEYATFLTNHDQNRVMSVLNGKVEKAKLAAFMLLTSPGTPFIYYGEEIGMQGRKPDEDIRLPMQWTSGKSAGFTTGTPWRELNKDFAMVNVMVQEEDPNSLLEHYRSLIKIRSQYPALRSGNTHLVETGNPAIYSVLRTDGNQTLLVLANLGGQPITDYGLSLDGGSLVDGEYSLRSLFGSGVASNLEFTNGQLINYQPLQQLPPYSVYLFLFEH